MSAEANKELINKMFAALHDGDFQSYLDCMHDDVEFTMTGSTRFSKTHKGKQAFIDDVITPIGSQLDGGVDMKIDSLIAEGDRVVMQSRGYAKTKAGKRYDNVYCQIFRIEDNKVKAVTEYLDGEVVTSAFGK